MSRTTNWGLKRRNHFLEDEKPVHRPSYCAFLDVLGFSARTIESYRNGTADELLGEFHKIFNEVIEDLRRDANSEYSWFFYKTFSDNVLMAVPIRSRDGESEFASVIVATSRYQFQMALKGFFIRGGFSEGSLFIDENSVYGEALISAYELENKEAINPIVILDDNTTELVRTHLTYYAPGEMWAPQRRLLLVNEHGRYFINYLDECIVETYEGNALDFEPLNLHKANIEEALEKYSTNPRVLAKFEWLAAYHNFFCDMVAGFENYAETLRVNKPVKPINLSRLT